MKKAALREKIRELSRGGTGVGEIQKILLEEGKKMPYHTIYGICRRAKKKEERARPGGRGLIARKMGEPDNPAALVEDIKRLIGELGSLYEKERAEHITNLKNIRINLIKARDELRIFQK